MTGIEFCPAELQSGPYRTGKAERTFKTNISIGLTSRNLTGHHHDLSSCNYDTKHNRGCCVALD